jgi:predicted nucleotidyltransferase
MTGAALTGSAARDAEHSWSDVDVFLGIAADAETGDVVADRVA